MNITASIGAVLIAFVCCVGIVSADPKNASQIKDPLRDYYFRNFSNPDFTPHDPSEGPEPTLTRQTEIYFFRAQLTDSKREAVFITDEEEYLGAHGKYGWSAYYPVGTSGYRLAVGDNDSSDFISAGLNGPSFVGFIDEIKRYGAIEGGKWGFYACYLVDGKITSKDISDQRDDDYIAAYPKYFAGQWKSRKIITYTLAELMTKYGSPKK